MHGLYHINTNSIIVAEESYESIFQLRLLLKSKIPTDILEIPDIYARDGHRYGFNDIIAKQNLCKFELDPVYMIQLKNYADYSQWLLANLDISIKSYHNVNFESAYLEPIEGLYPKNDNTFKNHFASINSAVTELKKKLHFAIYWEKDCRSLESSIAEIGKSHWRDEYAITFKNIFFTMINENKYNLV